VIYGEDQRYWSLFKPVLDEFERREINLLYLTSSPEDPVFQAGYRYIRGEYTGGGNRALARLNLLSADLALATTPGLEVYQWKRSRGVRHYAHVIHCTTDATQYRMFGLDYFDSVLLTGDYQGADIRRIEQVRSLPEKNLVTVGCSYLDEYRRLLGEIPREEPHEFTVLLSPSWGPSSLLTRYGEKLLGPLAESGFRVIVRPHPQSKISEAKILERLTAAYARYGNLSWDYGRDNIHSLARADIMISDFSGIIFDYAFLCDKPVLYANYELDLRPYDAHFLPGSELWQVKVLREIGVELREEDFPRIAAIIRETSESDARGAARRRAMESAWQYRGEAGKRTADFMIAVVDNIDADKTAGAP
jgi:hypothetical protein